MAYLRSAAAWNRHALQGKSNAKHGAEKARRRKPAHGKGKAQHGTGMATDGMARPRGGNEKICSEKALSARIGKGFGWHSIGKVWRATAKEKAEQNTAEA